MMKRLLLVISVIAVQESKAGMHVKYCVNLMKEVFFMQIEIQSNNNNPIKRMRSYLEMTQEQFSDAYGILCGKSSGASCEGRWERINGICI